MIPTSITSSSHKVTLIPGVMVSCFMCHWFSCLADILKRTEQLINAFNLSPLAVAELFHVGGWVAGGGWRGVEGCGGTMFSGHYLPYYGIIIHHHLT